MGHLQCAGSGQRVHAIRYASFACGQLNIYLIEIKKMIIKNKSILFEPKEALNEKRLGEVLSKILSQRLRKGHNYQVPFEKTKKRGPKPKWDYIFKVENKPIIIEFDGNHHYQNAWKLKQDENKNDWAKQLSYGIIRWPFWVQMDTITLKHYLNINFDVKTNFPHGFSGGTEYFPSCFCEKGVERFITELRALPISISNSVINSLNYVAEKQGIEWVLPKSLYNLQELIGRKPTDA